MNSIENIQIVEKHKAWPIETKNHTWEKIPRRRSHKDLAKFDSDQDKSFLAVVDRINQCFKAKHYEGAITRHDIFFNHLSRLSLFESLVRFTHRNRHPAGINRGCER